MDWIFNAPHPPPVGCGSDCDEVFMLNYRKKKTISFDNAKCLCDFLGGVKEPSFSMELF